MRSPRTASTAAALARPRRHRRWRALGALGLLTLLFSACGGEDTPQDIFDAKGESARKINDLQIPVFLAAAVVGIIVFVAVLVVVVKYRQRPGDDHVPHQLHGKTGLEIAWTILPALILIVVAVPTVALVIDLADTPDDALQIDVVGQQWWWEFSYPEQGIVTSGELVIPVDTDVVVNITSRDVIHSFWFPKLSGKKDAVPNRFHDIPLRAEETGEVWGQCAEFCGLSHANMRMRAVVLTQADWQSWVQEQQQPAAVPDEGTNAFAGYTTFNSVCASCHSVEGNPTQPGEVPLVAGAAPNLTHLMSRTTFAGAMYDLEEEGCGDSPEGITGTAPSCLNRADLEAWLRDPKAMKPMVPDDQRGMPTLGLSEDDISNLVDYLSTLK